MANLDLCAGSVDPIYPPGPGRMVTVIPLEITENGTYTAPNGYAYSPITADVSSPAPNDVTFYDYDGTVIAGYTAEQFASMTALPANPTHEGLVAQGWNWSLEDAKDYVAKYGKLNVGQMYTTDDGKTRLYLNRLVSGDKVTIALTPTVADGATIDWGDGSTTVTDSTDKKTYEHTYAAEITPVVTIDVTSGNVSIGGAATAFVNRIEIGNGVSSISNSAFPSCKLLTAVTIPDSVTSIGDAAFADCSKLTSITIPESVTTIYASTFTSCKALTIVSIPKGVTTIGASAFSYCPAITEITIPDSVTSIGDAAFQMNASLATVTIPDSVTSIGNGAVSGCSSLSDIFVYPATPPSVTSGAFSGSYKNLLIHVPAESLNAYKTASGWSDLADYIVAM